MFLEQCWRLEKERLLKAHPHTNVGYSNEQSGLPEYQSCLQHRLQSVILCKVLHFFHDFDLTKVVHLFFTVSNKAVKTGGHGLLPSS